MSHDAGADVVVLGLVSLKTRFALAAMLSVGLLAGMLTLSHAVLLPVGIEALLIGAALLPLLAAGRCAIRAQAAARAAAAAADAARVDAARARLVAENLLGELPGAAYRGDLMADGTFVCGFRTAGAGRLTGFSPMELAAPGAWLARIAGDSRADYAAFLAGLFSDGEAQVEYAFVHADGRELWLLDRARIVGLAERGCVLVAGQVLDVTRERALAAQSAQAAKLATLGEMSASLAHELAQPLSVMLFSAETARDALEDLGADAIGLARDQLDRIMRQIARTRTIATHLRDFGRSDPGPEEAVDLAQALEGAMVLAGPALARAGVAIEAALPPGLPKLRGQRLMVEQILVNLMLNARDAMRETPQGQRRLEIAADGLAGGQVELRVRDTGHGLPPGAEARIFEPFFTTKPLGQGTGLGLSICHGIMRRTGGSIRAENAAPGATMILTFQRAPAAGPEAALLAHPAANAS
jgi:signal transduction histidine kinase